MRDPVTPLKILPSRRTVTSAERDVSSRPQDALHIWSWLQDAPRLIQKKKTGTLKAPIKSNGQDDDAENVLNQNTP